MTTLSHDQITQLAVDCLTDYNRERTSTRAIGGYRYTLCPSCGRQYTATHRHHAYVCPQLRRDVTTAHDAALGDEQQ